MIGGIAVVGFGVEGDFFDCIEVVGCNYVFDYYGIDGEVFVN